MALEERPWQVGRHCVVVVGYCRDLRDVLDPVTGTPVTEALRIRNNWGPRWGTHGCGWLAFDLVRRGVFGDIWHIYRTEDA
jgi:C1A family cysteine protease